MPSAVRVAPLPLRLKRITHSSFSSALMAPVREGCAMYSRSAARLKEPVSAMAITSFSCCRVMPATSILSCSANKEAAALLPCMAFALL